MCVCVCVCRYAVYTVHCTMYKPRRGLITNHVHLGDRAYRRHKHSNAYLHGRSYGDAVGLVNAG